MKTIETPETGGQASVADLTRAFLHTIPLSATPHSRAIGAAFDGFVRPLLRKIETLKADHAAEVERLKGEAERLRNAGLEECNIVLQRNLEISTLAAENAALREEVERLRATAVSLREAADRPDGSISLIHQYDAKACCDMMDSHRANLTASRARIAELEGSLAMANQFIVGLGKRDWPHYTGDHACSQCHPHSDVLIEGFACAYHTALSTQAPEK